MGPSSRRRVALVTLALASLACGVGRDASSPTSAPWPRLAPPADLALDRPLAAGFLIVDGVYNSELMAPYDILHHTRFHTEPLPGVEVFTVSPDGEPVVSFEGLTIVPHYSFADHPPIEILVVPSTVGSMDADLQNETLIDWVRRVGGDARFVMSLCDGAFVLAAAGLLDGHVCTTFPGDQDRFAEVFPHLALERGVSFVHDGKTLTSEGGARSYDVAMYLVDHLYGEQVARGVGRGLIIPWPPSAAEVPARVVE